MSNNIGFKAKNAIIIGVALIVSVTLDRVPTAAALDQIQASREVPASVDKLWNIVSNVGNDPKCWNQIHTVNVLTMTGNIIQADTTLGPFNAKGHEIITLHPRQSVLRVTDKDP